MHYILNGEKYLVLFKVVVNLIGNFQINFKLIQMLFNLRHYPQGVLKRKMIRQSFVLKLTNYIPLDFSSQQISSSPPKEHLTFKFQTVYLLISCIHHMLENSN